MIERHCRHLQTHGPHEWSRPEIIKPEITDEMIDRALVRTVNGLRDGLSPTTIAAFLQVPYELIHRIGRDAGLIHCPEHDLRLNQRACESREPHPAHIHMHRAGRGPSCTWCLGIEIIRYQCPGNPHVDHDERCCPEHGTHSTPHKGCVLR